MDLVELRLAVADASQCGIELLADLDDQQLIGPQLETVNPLLWELGHTAWFQEQWVLRHACGRPPIREDGDALWDSSTVAHAMRWELPLPSHDSTLAYAKEVRERVLEAISGATPSRGLLYFVMLSVFHQDMHNEAFTYTRQTLGYPAPQLELPPTVTEGGENEPAKEATETDKAGKADEAEAVGEIGDDVSIEGGSFSIGARGEEPFIFDNEKWAHEVELAPFGIARHATSQAEFACFVDDGGYTRNELWSPEGRVWREKTRAECPVYWNRDGRSWLRRVFDKWVELEPAHPVIHVNFYEAEAYCRWADRRLPTEREWEAAAAGKQRRRFPWGNEAPKAEHANLDWRAGGTVPTSEQRAGDTPEGCRQMLGNVWEWTSTEFGPYPGFVSDAYKDYSKPWFAGHKVLRGGCWTTRARLLRNSWRNFYTPDRRDVWAGFRTAALPE